MDHILTGLDLLLEDPTPIGRRPWAMLTNAAAVTAGFAPGRLELARLAGSPKLLFAPEHGLEGVAQDMEAVDDTTDPLTGLRVRSLYGTSAATLEPKARDLDGLEAVVIDLPDIGTRYYTFAATMDAMMAACERAHIEVIVLDRPNPINGTGREGGLIRPGFESFVGRIPTPVRHGLTLGEIALLLQRERYPALELTVIPCRGWRRSLWLDETGLPWTAPSPNMPALETAILYPGMCLVEATNLSEGRGTTRPFKLIGAPWLDGARLAQELRRRQIPGVAVRPAWFRPAFGKHAGQICSGVELTVTGRQVFRPVAFGILLLSLIRRIAPETFGWRPDAYEFIETIPAIDLLTGDDRVRLLIEAGEDPLELIAAWDGDVSDFEQQLDDVLLYPG